MSDNFGAINYANSYARNYLLPKKIKTGAPWQADVEISGTTAFTFANGTLIVGKAPLGKSTNSTTAALKELVRLRSAARNSGTQ